MTTRRINGRATRAGSTRRHTALIAIVAALVLLLGVPGGVSAQRMAVVRPVPGQPGPGGMVNLPWMSNDGKGQMWRVYQNGALQNQGPTPNGGNTQTFSQAAMLLINGNNPQMQINQGKIDEKTGELVLENMQGPGYTVTRRIHVDKEGGYVRYIDVIKNTQGQDQNVQLMLSTNLNYGINTSQMVEDPRHKGQHIGWAAQTGSMACLFEMFAGKGSKLAPTIMAQPGNSQCQATFQVSIPAGKEVALMHLHGMVPTPDAGQQFITNVKEAQLLKQIPPNLRKLLINFAGGQNFIGDLEILRGDLLDVVELKSGDQLKGTLKEPTFDVTTFYGPVSLPVDKVIGLLNVGQFRPRQLVVTTDGQVFGGKLKKETLDLQLSSGQVTQIPLSQVNRVGYRKRPGEPEEWTFDKPMVLMRSGERIAVRTPTGPIEVATRYGKLSLRPEQVAAVLLATEDNGVHQVFLADGGKFSGLLAADSFEMTLDTGGAGPEQVVKFPVSAIARFQLTPKVAEIEEATPTIKLANDDLLVGTVTGQLKVDTNFDTITVNAGEIKSMAHPKENPTDVQLVMFDGSTLSGQLQELDLPVQTAGGLSLKVPLALLEEYSQPQPQPSKDLTDKIKKVVEDLNSKDWKQRDRAEAALLSMGPAAIGVLKQLRQDQPPEAQQRFDNILQQLEKQQKNQGKPGGAGASSGGPGAPVSQPVPAIFDRFEAMR
jgi:hypothetical protein